MEGKLKKLISAFEKVNSDSDTSEIESIIELLESYNWNVKGVNLLVKLEMSGPLIDGDDISYYSSLLKNDSALSDPLNLTENEKLDKLDEIVNSEIFHGDRKQVQTIIETLKL